MRYASFLALALACSPNPNAPRVSGEPVSVRGWIADVEGSTYTVKTQLFQSTNVWVDNAPYVSGGVAENGSFLLLDVPPGNVTITFTAPGAPAARLVLQNIPGNADVLVPALLLRRGSVALLDPKGVQVRMAAHISRPMPTGGTVVVAGISIPVMNAPYAAMVDRHDYPNPPRATTPLATVR